MTLGEKLKQARLEAQLSQRQLCGDTITRNMLSQIENGSAKPSYATLQVLSRRLGKPVSYFLEDAPSQNIGLLHQAQTLPAEEALLLLEGYLLPDPGLDSWYWLLTAQCCIELAEKATEENRAGKAQHYLSRGKQALEQVPRFAPLYRRRILLTQYRLEGDAALAEELPDNTAEQLMRGALALAQNRPEQCLSCLDAADTKPDAWCLLRADALMALEQWQAAAALLQSLETRLPEECLPRLEQCYRELKNFEKAYEYACKRRDLT